VRSSPPFFGLFSECALLHNAYLEMHCVRDVVHDCNRLEAVSFLLN
jgi:hypothetical protein